MIDITTQHQAEEIAKESWERLRTCKEVGGRDIGTLPAIHFLDTGEKYNGLGYPDKIQLNIRNVGMLTTDEFLAEVIPHELAHSAQFRLTGASAHDDEWRDLCIAAGGTGEIAAHFAKIPAWMAIFMVTGVISTILLAACVLARCGVTNAFWGGAVSQVFGGLTVVLWAFVCGSYEHVIRFAIIQSVIQTTVFIYLTF